MPNPLTGAFDVAVEVAVPALNLALAAQHQEGRYLHSVALRVPPEGTEDGSGISAIADVQASAPAVTLPAGGIARVTAHYQLMIRVRPFASSAGVPEFIHGELQINADAARVASSMGEHIRINLGADDVGVTFTPDSGAPLPADQRRAVDQAIHHFVRTGFEPVNQRIRFPGAGEAAVRHWRFKTLPAGSPPAAALLLNLRDVPPTDAHLDGFTNVFLESTDDFALAVSAEFLLSELRRLIREGLAGLDSLEVRVRRPVLRDCRYRVSLDLDGLRVEARSGRIDITIRGRVDGNRFTCPDYSFRISQGLVFRPSRDGRGVELAAEGDADVDVSGFLSRVIESEIRGQVRSARDRVVREAQPIVDQMFASLDGLLEELAIGSIALRYTDVDMLPEGVVVRGRFDVAWQDVVATYDRRAFSSPGRPGPELELDAFRSWIPGGTVRRYRWLHGSERVVEHEIIEEHRFVTRVLPPLAVPSAPCLWPPCRWCLEVRGTQGRLPSGAPRDVIGWSCSIVGGGIVDIPAGFGPGEVRFPIPVVDAAGEVVGHVDLREPRRASDRSASRRGRSRVGSNLLLHFPGTSPEDLPVLRDLMSTRTKVDTALFGLVVVKPDSAGLRKTLVDDPGQTLGLAWTEDFEGSWAKAFSVAKPPVTVLLDARGSVAWRQDGPLNRPMLKAALDQHLRPVGSLRYWTLRLHVQEGEQAPDFLFDYADGKQMALRTFRGDPVVVSFWTSWSEPSLSQLRELRGLHKDRRGLVILAVNDGEDPQVARACYDRERFPFQFVSDPHRGIARLFGVRVWPTTILIDEKRTVRQIQLGRASPRSGRQPRPEA
jgi:peroxiredoxin